MTAGGLSVGPGTPPSNRIPRDRVGFWYDPLLPPVLSVAPGETVVFETLDARSGALDHIPAGTLFELPKPPVGRGNPLTGPLEVRGAQPGDTLVIDIDDIRVHSPGWTGGHAHVNPLAAGRIPRPMGRRCEVVDGEIVFSETIRIPGRAMIGCIGTAVVGEKINAGYPGRFGGNMDQKIMTAGTTVYLPVAVPGALLYIGHVHAGQGDGELSGVALEIAADVTVRTEIRHGLELSWPWVETPDVLAVLTAAPDFVEARREAVEAVLSALERQLGLESAEALALLSTVGDLRVGQAFGGPMDLTLRLEVPRSLGLRPG